ncbi:hypothetical protein UA08_07826 [Talaromyces atroroseus]|uniref:DUF4187 domain-containing protein n=1 Tax=Talaromyces atroroseus TaxID=1441469 RepID=A0A225AR75_TALAT|nr:hypothetical protein UA08_07826 [Talaromyces atroroseus]OKL56955.1 hypothetical protein UA08_07826 [Talaromyces atroroseus]
MPPNHARDGAGDGDEDEDDYMSMIIEEPTQQRETLTQRKLRKQRESEAKARIPSKAERAAAEVTRREHALSASVLDPANKGFQMMAKLGFKAGDALGKKALPQTQTQPQPQTPRKDSTIVSNDNDNDNDKKQTEGTTGTQINDWIQSRAEPLRLIVKEDRGGIGLDSEKKRKFRAEADELVSKNARAKAEEGEYRERMRAEREERRLEAQVHAAQKVAEKLDCEDELTNSGGEDEKKQKHKQKKKPTSQVNVLYRGLVREREEKERDRLVRAIFENSMSTSSAAASFFPKPRLPSYSNPADEDDDDGSGNNKTHALQDTEENITFEEQETDADATEEDEELNEFNALPASARLDRLVAYMREKYWYCFWCKYRYDEAGMEGCPGLTEEDHD